MFRKSSLFAVAAVLLLSPTRIYAGGPPWLCLPIDGVTPANMKACTDLLTAKLDSKISPHARERGIQLLEHANQWFLTFAIGEDVALSEVEAALKGSEFSVPRDRLRLFGHVILEIDPRTASQAELLADLKAIEFVSVGASNDKEGRLLVTVDMPYPAGERGSIRGSVAWDTFQRTDLSSDQATRSESPATTRTLPGYEAIREVVAKHNASLKDVRWSTNHACRPLGGVAAPAQPTGATAGP